jgi:hypothetical protein
MDVTSESRPDAVGDEMPPNSRGELSLQTDCRHPNAADQRYDQQEAAPVSVETMSSKALCRSRRVNS